MLHSSCTIYDASYYFHAHMYHVLHHVLVHCIVIDFVPVFVFLCWVEPGDDSEFEVPVETVFEEEVYDPPRT